MRRLLVALVVCMMLFVTPVWAASGNYTNVQQALTTSAQVKSTSGNIYGYAIYNPNAAATWVMYYNTTTAPTIGSTTNLVFEFAVPNASTVNVEFSQGIQFSSGLYVAVATTANGSSAPSTGLTITTVYR